MNQFIGFSLNRVIGLGKSNWIVFYVKYIIDFKSIFLLDYSNCLFESIEDFKVRIKRFVIGNV